MLLTGAVLLEREHELGRIDAALAAARDGVGNALLVEGPAGIGKTALLEAAQRRALSQGVLVLASRGTEIERGYALGVVRQCLLPAVHAVGGEQRERLLSGAAAVAAPVVLDNATPPKVTTRFEMLHGLYWLVANLLDQLGRPAMLVIDDAQWADESSLRFLAFLVRRTQSLPLVVLTAARSPPADAQRESESLLWEARTDPAMELLAPLALGEQAVAQLLDADDPTALDAAFVRACQRATGGNPFLLGQLVATLRAEGVPFTAAAAAQVLDVTPPDVSRGVHRKLAALGEAAAALARAVAVLGDNASVVEAAALADLDVAVARETASVLGAAGLLDVEWPLRFRHPLLRGAVSQGMNGAERDRWHRRAVELLAQQGASSERQALHLLVVAPAGQAQVSTILRTAAQLARERGAPDSAATLLARALAEPPPSDQRHELLTELAEVKHAAGDSVAAADHAAEAFESAPDATTRARVLDIWGTVVGPDLVAMASLAPLVHRTLIELGEGEREIAMRLRAQLLAAMLPDPNSDPAGLAALIADAERLTGDTPGEAAVLGILVFHLVAADGTAEQVGRVAERAAHQARALMTDGSDTKAFSGVVHGLRWSERLELAEQLLIDAITLARARGARTAFAFGSATLAEVRRRRGMLREAEADARAGIAAAEGWALAMATGALAACLLDRGRVTNAWQTLDAAGLTGTLGPSPPETEILLARMRVRAAAGERAAALADWQDAQARPVRGAPTASWIESYVVIADVMRAHGDAASAASLCAEALELARHWGTPGAIGEALRGVARANAEKGAIDTLEDAIIHLQRSPNRLVHAHALVDLGSALRRRGDRRQSREPLSEALILAQTCGADGLAEHARHELAASGLKSERDTDQGGELLTASEQRIAEMAATGASNAEIAQSLFISLKTVEMHLTHSYRKLAITGRPDLAAALQRVNRHRWTPRTA